MNRLKLTSESHFVEETRDVPRLGHTVGDNTKTYHDNFTTFSSLNSAACVVLSNYHFVESHLSHSKPHLVFLTETRVFETNDLSWNIFCKQITCSRV